MGNEEYKLLIEVKKELQELKNLIVRQNNTTNEYVDIGTICRSFKISKDTLRRYRQEGLIPYHQIKGKVYFIESEVKDALRQHYYGCKNSK